jgi:hypothetical protein
MLTAEEKARIEEEERKRIAEEQYRAEVRSKLQRSVPEAKAEAPRKNIGGRVIGVILIAIIAFSIGSYLMSRSDRIYAETKAKMGPIAKSVEWVTQKDSIASGQITVRRGGYVFYKVEITPGMSKATVSGSFTASGGAGNDVEGVLADEEGYTNWINGHEARVFWSTQGRETTGRFSTMLTPGTYYLVFSNKFSLLTDKDVFVDVSLTYQKPQPGF